MCGPENYIKAMVQKGATIIGDIKLVNCTPHPIMIHGTDSVTLLESSGIIPRVSTKTIPVGNIGSITLYKSTLGKVTGLPRVRGNTKLIVSRMVVSACPTRADLLSPGELIRDDDGKVIGCKGLSI